MNFQTDYAGRRILLTGHTGFKGSWLALWLSRLGAKVTGFSLPADSPSLFDQIELHRDCEHIEGDIRDIEAVRAAVRRSQPELVFHLAAQPLVRRGYAQPAETIETNVVGTARLLDAVRETASCPVLVVTSDKCYEHAGAEGGCKEGDRLGGRDPYAMSKAAQEWVASTYRDSFGMNIATARAGNVIGGGDWAQDRILPDVVRAIMAGRPVMLRRPDAVRPWQHVLEPLGGYLMLGAELLGTSPKDVCEAWNFGPLNSGDRSVREVVEKAHSLWGAGTWKLDGDVGPHEAPVLRLDASKATNRLGWAPRFGFDETLELTVEWYKAFAGGADATELRRLCAYRIDRYLGTAVAA